MIPIPTQKNYISIESLKKIQKTFWAINSIKRSISYLFVDEVDDDKNTSSGPCHESNVDMLAGVDLEFPMVFPCDKAQSQFRCMKPLNPISIELIKAT